MHLFGDVIWHNSASSKLYAKLEKPLKIPVCALGYIGKQTADAVETAAALVSIWHGLTITFCIQTLCLCINR